MKLSIITINLNNAEGLRKTIESVVSQTFTDFEYIVIDGASTDGSVDIINQFADKITYWLSEPDKGIYNAMNKGIIKAKGEYLQFLNSGDWLYSDSTLQDIFCLNKTEDILYGDLYSVSKDGTSTFVTYPSKLTLDFFLYDNICHQAAFIKKNLLVMNPYNEEFKIASDWDFFLKQIVLQNCSISKMSKTVVFYQDFGISSCEIYEQLHIKEREEILKNNFPQRILLDYLTLRKFKEEQKTIFFKNIRFIMQYPNLHKLVRRLLRVIVYVFRFNRRCHYAKFKNVLNKKINNVF